MKPLIAFRPFYWIVLLVLHFNMLSQILDDSTKLIYNARSSRYCYGSDWLMNRSTMSAIDTNILNHHNYLFHFRDGILYQDLGNLGTALRRVYWEQASEPGRMLGHDTYRDYMFDPEKIPLYNTRSPFTRLSYIQGSRGLQTLDAEFSRNITPGWNVGFDVRRMVSLKQIGVVDRSDQQFSNYGFIAQTNFTSKKENYRLYAWMDVMHHFHYENGGIEPDPFGQQDFMFDYNLEKVNLVKGFGTKARLQSNDRRTSYRLYQQLSIVKKYAQVFHQLDYTKRIVLYEDNNLIVNDTYYPAIIFDSVDTRDHTWYELMENKAGIKGSIGKLYYQGYARHRLYNYKQAKDLFFQKKEIEIFTGGLLEFRLKDSLYASGQVEQSVNDYRYKGSIVTPYGQASITAMSSSPGLMQENYISNHFIWNNSFKNINSVVTNVQGNLRWKGQEFIPRFTLTTVDNLIYYDTAALPQQSAQQISFTQLGGKLKIGYKVIWLENEVVLTTVQGPEYWPVPEWTHMGRLYLYGRIFKKVLLVQPGVEAITTAAYANPSYMPVTQQFHLTPPSDPLAVVNSYTQVNVFLNAYLKRAKFFLLVSHANQNLPYAGYFRTPYYTALGRTIHFGVTWMFYD